MKSKKYIIYIGMGCEQKLNYGILQIKIAYAIMPIG